MTGRPNLLVPPFANWNARSYPNSATRPVKISTKQLLREARFLSTFPTCNDLLSHFREPQKTDVDMSRSDDVLGELLRMSHDPRLPIGRTSGSLLIMMPAIHRPAAKLRLAFRRSPAMTSHSIS